MALLGILPLQQLAFSLASLPSCASRSCSVLRSINTLIPVSLLLQSAPAAAPLTAVMPGLLLQVDQLSGIYLLKALADQLAFACGVWLVVSC